MKRDTKLRIFFVANVLTALTTLTPAISGAATFSITTTNDSGAGSLRDAITLANTTPGQDLITFVLPDGEGGRITPASALPEITEPVVIDGYSQSNSFPNAQADQDDAVILIEIDGSQAGTNANGLVVSSGSSTIRGIAINGFNDEILLCCGGSNVVEGCFIGCHASGTGGLGDDGAGVRIDNSAGNLIGGTTPSARNLISGNGGGFYGGMGVTIMGSNATANLVRGNFIGVDYTGTNVLFQDDGVQIISASGNIIGGTSIGAGNLISGNGRFGVLIGVRDDVGGVATDNVVQGNIIGSDPATVLRIGNGSGVCLGDSGSFDNLVTDNLIGGTMHRAGNVILGNGVGVRIQARSSHNKVQGNDIVRNGFEGVLLCIGAHDNVVGGTALGAGNLISANQLGVAIRDDALQAYGNIIQGNFIGTDASGTAIWGNYEHGVLVRGSHNIIGGTTNGAGNLVSGNFVGGTTLGIGSAGIEIDGSENVVQGNFVGIDVTGTQALPNFGDGILVYENASTPHGGYSNVIGGAQSGAGNTSSGNLFSGIHIAVSDWNVVSGNRIGTDLYGNQPLGNGTYGVEINGFSNDVGGISMDAGNTIAYNHLDGVFIDGGVANNLITRNSIHDNGRLGIRIVYPPCACSLALTGAISAANTTTIQGTLTGESNMNHTVEFYSNPSCDPSGRGEGQSYIGSIMPTTDASGRADFEVTFPVSVDLGQYVAATVTDGRRDTSEFSQCLQIPTGLVESGVVHDLAITGIKLPRHVTLTRRKLERSVILRVDLQNRASHTETITDVGALTNLVKLSVIPLSSNCPMPRIVFRGVGSHLALKATVQPRQTVGLVYVVVLDCASDPLKSQKDAAHPDYRVTARVDHIWVDGKADNHPDDDVCPRDVPTGGGVDPNPDGSIVDRGCGEKKRDGTFGGELLIDIIAK